MSQDQRPGAITMVDGQTGAAKEAGGIIVEDAHGSASAGKGKGGKGGGLLPLLLFAVGAAAAGAAVARLGVGT